MSPRDLTLWTEAMVTLLPPNRYTNTPRKWFMNVWFWELKAASWYGKVSYKSSEFRKL